MNAANKLMMASLNVSDMPKAKEFYSEKLGFKITTDYRQDDNNWWVSLELPEGGATLTLSRASMSPDAIKSDTLTLYFETNDVEAAHKELKDKNVDVSDITDDLFGQGSGVKWLNVADPDGTRIFFVAKHEKTARTPF